VLHDNAARLLGLGAAKDAAKGQTAA